MKKRTTLLTLVVLIILTIMVTACATGASVLPAQERLRVATTSSLYDTGFWAYLEPKFEQKYNVALDIIYANTGIAIEYGKRGDVDALTIHDKAREQQFVADGYGVKRNPFAYNYFLIVGTTNDPAGIKNLTPEAAFKKLIEEGTKNPAQIRFVSRGDGSGTHSKEQAIWKAAGFNYTAGVEGSSWAKAGAEGGYMEAGQGMGPTLLMASQKNAYTLTDIGTFLAYKGKLNLVPIVETAAGKVSILLNVYSVIALNPQKFPNVNIKMAQNLVDFFISPEGQNLIGSYGVKDYGKSLFTPCAGNEPKQ
ncbi:MAG: tungsten ABC transporter substrate-binding protein [Chloroflexi bacterium CG08_land_8_20_14_0_20_45_12]|nr:MAG: tungsten ABC transporter substrate-binding protein [Chloroflexi bacterium CG08_land_8_20_14_0_20_45_12]